MQYSIFEKYDDYSNKKIMIGLSGGINSMAVLCWLSQMPESRKPKELHLFYAHFEEHSPGTLYFVIRGILFARKHFKKVFHKITYNSVLDFFIESKMIPHPMVAPCTRILKILPMLEYFNENEIDLDLIGYVKSESRRVKNMHKKRPDTKKYKAFPIISKNNEWCFDIVRNLIGRYPRIYDIKDRKGKRVFKHNNCLPCKNMNTKDFLLIKEHFHEYWEKAMQTAEKIKQYWGRNADEFYTTFGRDDLGNDEQTCEHCAFD